jgi:hypothetical protein
VAPPPGLQLRLRLRAARANGKWHQMANGKWQWQIIDLIKSENAVLLSCVGC